MRKLLLFMLCAVLCLLVTACSSEDEEAPPTPEPAMSVRIDAPLPREDEVQFELNNDAPNFGAAISGAQVGGVDLSNIPDYTDQLLENQNVDGEGDASQGGSIPVEDASPGGGIEQVETPEPELTPSQAIPTPDTKYPNTGIFLEDD